MPVPSFLGDTVAFGQANYKLWLWSERKAGLIELAAGVDTNTNGFDMSGDGKFVVYESRSPGYDISVRSTEPDATAYRVSLETGYVRASDPSISASANTVVYLSKDSASAKKELWCHAIPSTTPLFSDSSNTIKLSDINEQVICSASSFKPTMLAGLQASWGSDPGYDFGTNGVTSVASSSCQYAGLVG